MTKAFNLLDEPWIPVRTHAGEVRDVGLLDATVNVPLGVKYLKQGIDEGGAR